jgi:hypothetical protein
MSDFSVYTAEQIADWLSQAQIDSAPSSVFVGLIDQSDTEVSGNFANGRVEAVAGADWTIVSTGFENASDLSFGEATTDISNIEDVALFDGDLATGANELARFTLTDAPFDVSDGTVLAFNAGDLSFDVVDRTE